MNHAVPPGGPASFSSGSGAGVSAGAGAGGVGAVILVQDPAESSAGGSSLPSAMDQECAVESGDDMAMSGRKTSARAEVEIAKKS